MEQFIQKYPYNQLFENNADSHFYIKIGGTVYDVTTHYDPKGRQCVLEQFKELLLQRVEKPLKCSIQRLRLFLMLLQPCSSTS